MAGGLSTGLVGEIRMWAGQLGSLTGTVQPITGWLLCNGALISTSTYDDLFALAGHAYNGGVDPGSSQFKLPDFRGRGPVGLDAGTFSTRGATGGAETVVLNYQTLPAHAHTHTISTDGLHTHTGLTGFEQQAHVHDLIVNYGVLRSDGGANTAYTFFEFVNLGLFTSIENTTHFHAMQTTASSPTSHTHGYSYASSGAVGSPAHNNVSSFTGVHWIVKF